ncbi:MAG TPA: purine-nucleoside phosphorylase [Gemmatimonadaceae bacterium]
MTARVAATDAPASALRRRLDGRSPRLALILGSGLGAIVEEIRNSVEIPFADLPGFPPTTVAGHRDRILAGTLDGHEVLAFAGRFHLYEGHDARVVALPVRVAHAVGARTLLVTNAAGGIRRTFRTGDLMLIRDHINMTWRNPLTGPVAPNETRFPDLSAPYDTVLLDDLRAAAREAQLTVVEGVYAALLGPSYETPAEIRMLERLGADAVGMSTVPEVLAARALRMRVAGVSCITNPASGIGAAPLDHAEVLEAADRAAAGFQRLVRAFVKRQPDRDAETAIREPRVRRRD